MSYTIIYVEIVEAPLSFWKLAKPISMYRSASRLEQIPLWERSLERRTFSSVMEIPLPVS